MKLSENFSLQELTKSQTAERKGIDNTPSAEHQENLKSLCTSILQPVRDHFGRVVDFEIFGVSNKELADYINENLEDDQLILEYWKESDPNSGWVHCSFSQNQKRRQYLKATKINGATKYDAMV